MGLKSQWIIGRPNQLAIDCTIRLNTVQAVYYIFQLNNIWKTRGPWGPESLTWVNRPMVKTHHMNKPDYWKLSSYDRHWLKVKEWSWPILQNVYVLICLTVFINFGAEISCKSHKLFPCESPESKFDLAIKLSRSIQCHNKNIFGQRSSKLSIYMYLMF